MKQTKSRGEVVDQAVRPLARRAVVEDPRVVLDPRAEADLAQHLHVVLGALAQAVRLEQLALPLELRAARLELGADRGDRALGLAVGDVVVRGRPDRDVLEVVGDQFARQRIELRQRLDVVAEEHGAIGGLGIGREDLERLALDAEVAAREHGVVAGVLDRDELVQQRVAIDRLAASQQLHVALVDVRRAEAVDARDRGHHDHVAAGEHSRRRRMAQAVDLGVDRRILLDVEVAAGDVRLRLVVVVVGDEVLDGVVGEVGPKLVAQLRRERLVVGDHERRALHRLDRAGHRHRLAGPGRAEQRREAIARRQAGGDLLDCARLVGGGRERGVESKGRHPLQYCRSHGSTRRLSISYGRPTGSLSSSAFTPAAGGRYSPYCRAYERCAFSTRVTYARVCANAIEAIVKRTPAVCALASQSSTLVWPPL